MVKNKTSQPKTISDEIQAPLEEKTTNNPRNYWSGMLAATNSPAFWKMTAIVLFAVIILTQLFEVTITPRTQLFAKLDSKETTVSSQTAKTVDTTSLAKEVVPESFILPVTWNDLGKRMVADGVIDEQKFRALFEEGFNNMEEQMLTGNLAEPVEMTQQNSRYMLDMLWAFGLANKNEILENGEMTDEQYGGDASKFASTGGWSLSKGAGFDHYSKHAYVSLTPEQQALVDEVSSNIYRPCCGNSTHFPDCNHGMAMLGLLQLMAANGVDEETMYQTALQVNILWFPQTYIDLATYFKEQGTDWGKVDPKLALSQDYSSARGYQQTRQQIQSLPKPQQGGGGCGV